MQKMRLLLGFSLVLSVILSANAVKSASAADHLATTPNLEQFRILYQRNPDQEGSQSAAIEWDVSKKICHTKNQDSPKSPWVKLPPEKCRKIQTYLTQNWSELKKRSELGLNARGRANLQGPHVPLAEIRFSNIKLGVLAHQIETCDVTMTHCESDSKDAADQLGYLVSSILAAAF